MAKLNNNELNAINSEYTISAFELEAMSAQKKEFEAVVEAIGRAVEDINNPGLVPQPVFTMSDIHNPEAAEEKWGVWADEMENEKALAEGWIVARLRKFGETRPEDVVNVLEEGVALGGGLGHSVVSNILRAVGCPYNVTSECPSGNCSWCPLWEGESEDK